MPSAFFDDDATCFINAVRRYNTAHAGKRINIRVSANDCAGVEDAVASYVAIIADDGAEFSASGRYCFAFACSDDDI